MLQGVEGAWVLVQRRPEPCNQILTTELLIEQWGEQYHQSPMAPHQPQSQREQQQALLDQATLLLLDYSQA